MLFGTQYELLFYPAGSSGILFQLQEEKLIPHKLLVTIYFVL
jgi:hypothetical protein